MLSLRPHPHRRGRRELRPPPVPAQAARSAHILRPDAAPFGPLPASEPPRSLPEQFRETGRAPFQPETALSAHSGRRDCLPSAQTLIGAAGFRVPKPGDQRLGETLWPPIPPGLPLY
ncbi:MAG: hypothetical protein QXP01_07365 [Candidatus Hadarchaeum sp.]